MSIYTAAPDHLVAAQNLIIATARADIEIGMWVSQLLHFTATIKERFKLFIRHFI